MIDPNHQASVYAELLRHIDLDKPINGRTLHMSQMTARQLFDADDDPKFKISKDAKAASFCHIPIMWTEHSFKRIELRQKDALLYSIIWDPDPYNKAKLTHSGPRAMRFNEGKLQWALVDFECLEDMVRVLEKGCVKYERDNWKLGLPMRAQCESMARHLFALMSGEINDPETGLPHWAHIQCNALFMAHTFKHHPHHNDLPELETS